MDAVILAAGIGSRLNGIVAPYHKPLMVVNGESLLGRAVRQAYDIANVREVIVVVAPQNAQAIDSILPAHVRMAIQRRPEGPLDALKSGAGLSSPGQILVLMGDNLHTDDSIAQFARDTPDNLIGVRAMRACDVGGLSWQDDFNGRWYEKVEMPEPLLNSDVQAWCGPVRMNRNEILMGNGENISPLFNLYPFKTVPVESYDLGTPEALR